MRWTNTVAELRRYGVQVPGLTAWRLSHRKRQLAGEGIRENTFAGKPGC
jgi:hypothetical protein